MVCVDVVFITDGVFGGRVSLETVDNGVLDAEVVEVVSWRVVVIGSSDVPVYISLSINCVVEVF